MRTLRPTRRDERGQVLALFVISLTVIVLAVGLVIDGGTALLQRRASQNASDFAALAGARVIAERIGGDTTQRHGWQRPGRDHDVDQCQRRHAHHLWRAERSAVRGQQRRGPGLRRQRIHPGLPGQRPVHRLVRGRRDRGLQPQLDAVFPRHHRGRRTGARAPPPPRAAAMRRAVPPARSFPAGIAAAFFNGRTSCSEKDISTDPASPCYPQHLTPGDLNVPGGFGWLKFGCSGYGLGQVPPASNGGCANSKPFLQTEIGPPPDSFGCCTAVKLPGSADLIGSLPGNKASADCSYYINSGAVVTVPVWDSAGGTGSERLLPHHRLHRLAAHRLRWRQGHRGCLARPVLPGAHHDHPWLRRGPARGPAHQIGTRRAVAACDSSAESWSASAGQDSSVAAPRKT